MVNDNDAPLILEYDNKIFKHYFGCDNKLNEYHCHYASFYCDLNQKINKIKDGYRVCVTYNLYWNRNLLTIANGNIPQSPGASKLNETYNNICNLVRLWNDENNNVITFILQHSYSKYRVAGKGINCLEGMDLERAQLLITAAKYLVC